MASGPPFVRRIDARPFAESAKLHSIEFALLPNLAEQHIAMCKVHLQDRAIDADANAAKVQGGLVWRDRDGELLEPVGQPQPAGKPRSLFEDISPALTSGGEGYDVSACGQRSLTVTPVAHVGDARRSSDHDPHR